MPPLLGCVAGGNAAVTVMLACGRAAVTAVTWRLTWAWWPAAAERPSAGVRAWRGPRRAEEKNSAQQECSRVPGAL